MESSTKYGPGGRRITNRLGKIKTHPGTMEGFLSKRNIVTTKRISGWRQVCILQKRVDGLVGNIIYEFLGDFFHGNPKGRFNKNDYNKICHKTFGELYDNTIKRFNLLKDNGYIIKYIWESDWKNWLKNKIGDIPLQEY